MNEFQQVSTDSLTEGHKNTPRKTYSTFKKPRLSSQRVAECPFVHHSPRLTTEEHEAAAGLPWEHSACADGFKLAQGQCSFSAENSPKGLNTKHKWLSSPLPVVKVLPEAKAWKCVTWESKATTSGSESTKHTVTFTSELELTHLYFKGQVDTRYFSCSSFGCEGNNTQFWVLLPPCQLSCRVRYNSIQSASLGEHKDQSWKIPLWLT